MFAYDDFNYNIPSNNRELQHPLKKENRMLYYNIPSNNRELQPMNRRTWILVDYNIPSNNRELQLKQGALCKRQIITYQVITGNYNPLSIRLPEPAIITYQVITGNYNHHRR